MLVSPSSSSERNHTSRGLVTLCKQLVALDLSEYTGKMITPSMLAALLGMSKQKRPIYSILNVAIGCGALVKVGDRQYRWEKNVPVIPAGSPWWDVTLRLKPAQGMSDGMTSLTARVMRYKWRKPKSVARLAARMEVTSRRLYEVAAVLAAFGVLTRLNGSKTRYSRAKSVDLTPLPPSPKRNVTPPTVETRSVKKRRKEAAKETDHAPIIKPDSAAAKILFPSLASAIDAETQPMDAEDWWDGSVSEPLSVPREGHRVDALLFGQQQWVY